jgi:iron(III) transport system ATP-binding protein
MQKVEVKFENITKKFNETIAVDDVSCIFEAGTLTTLLGPSGCGKTTSLRLIAGLERASSGKIFIDNEDVTLLPATDRDVSMVFQSYALFPHMSVIENVSYGLKMAKVKKNEYIEKSIETLKLVNLEGYENRMPSELSGGQQQRVAVARAIVLEPKVLLFDEPLSNLDAKLRRQVREDIRNIQQRLGVTTIYVTHDQEESLAISDNVIVMNKSIIAQEGKPIDLYDNPNTKFVANFIGDANIIKAEATSESDTLHTLKIGEVIVEVNSTKKINKTTSIALRPEKININKNKKENSLVGKIISASFVGNSYQYTISTNVGKIYVISHDTINNFELNSEVFLSFEKKDIKILDD